MNSVPIPITEPDTHYLWCVENTEALKPFRGGFVAVRLPQGLVAGGSTMEAFEAQMNLLSATDVNHLYVTAVDIFFDDALCGR